MNGQLVSIIIPTLNEATGIKATLETLQDARAGHHELILVDGGSSDNTLAIAEPLVDRIIRSPAGRAVQMNAGASAASADILWFLHADTQPHSQSLEALLEAAIHTGGPTFWGRFDVRIDGHNKLFRLIEYMMNCRSRATSVATGDQGIFVSKALFQRSGGFAEIPLMEDIEYSKRLRRLCKPINLANRITTSSRRWRSGGIMRTVLLMWWMRLGYVCGVSPARLASWYRQQRA